MTTIGFNALIRALYYGTRRRREAYEQWSLFQCANSRSVLRNRSLEMRLLTSMDAGGGGPLPSELAQSTPRLAWFVRSPLSDTMHTTGQFGAPTRREIHMTAQNSILVGVVICPSLVVAAQHCAQHGVTMKRSWSASMIVPARSMTVCRSFWSMVNTNTDFWILSPHACNSAAILARRLSSRMS